MRMRTCLSALALSLAFPALVSADVLEFTQDLALGSIDPEVSFLQEVLCQTADFFPDCVIDGTYGPETQNAVIRFQYYVGMQSPNGAVDDLTRPWLNALIEAGTATEFNARLTDTLTAYRTMPDDSNLALLTTALQDRAESMRRLFRVNATKAREFLFPKKLRNRLPRSLRVLVELDRARAIGTVIDHIAEQPDTPFAISRYKYIQTKKGVVFIPYQDERLPDGARAYARGIQLDDMLLPNTGIKDVRVLSAPPLESALSMRSALPSVLHLYAILLDFPDLQRNQTRQAMVDALNLIPAFYQAASGGKTRVDLRVSQWYRSTETFDSLKCNWFGMLNEALALANAEFNYTQYPQGTSVLFIYPGFFTPGQPPIAGCTTTTILPAFTCPHGGVGGARGIQHQYPTPDGPVDLGVATVTDGIVDCDPRRPRTQIHEYTHTVGPGGFDHPGVLYCPERSWENDAPAAGCTKPDDPFDVMGNGNTNDFGPITKELFGWLDSRSELMVTSPGTYTLGVYERATAANRVLRLPGSNGRNFYVTYRQAEGLDAPPQGTTDEFAGALMYSSPPVFPKSEVHSYLLSADIPHTGNINRVAFHVNQTLYDPQTQWAITPVARTADNLTVAVDQLAPFSCVGPGKIATGTVATFTAVGVSQLVTWSAPDGTPSTGTGSTFHSAFAQAGIHTVTYAFTTTNGALVSAVCSINVVEKPMVNLTASDNLVHERNNAVPLTLRWDTSDATTCKLAVSRFAMTPWEYSLVPLVGSWVDEILADGTLSVPGPFVAKLRCQNGGISTADYVVVNAAAGGGGPDGSGNNSRCLYVRTSMEPPAVVAVGDTFRTQVVMQNTGVTTWRADASPIRLYAMSGLYRSWLRVPLRREVAPGGIVVFSFDSTVEVNTDPLVAWKPIAWQMGEYFPRLTPGIPECPKDRRDTLCDVSFFGEECESQLWGKALP